MSGLFEDDANVRKIAKPKAPPKATIKKARKKSLASKILAKVESKDRLVNAASAANGGIKFEDVDVSPAAQATVKKQEKGVIAPQINYVSDTDD